MVRTLDDRIRAFVSNKYRRLDNFDLIEAVLPTLEEGNANIVSCEVTEKYLYLKAIMPDNRFIIPRQDGGTPGRRSGWYHDPEFGSRRKHFASFTGAPHHEMHQPCSLV